MGASIYVDLRVLVDSHLSVSAAQQVCSLCICASKRTSVALFLGVVPPPNVELSNSSDLCKRLHRRCAATALEFVSSARI